MDTEISCAVGEAIHAASENQKTSTLAGARDWLAPSVTSPANSCVEAQLANEFAQLQAGLKITTNAVDVDRGSLYLVGAQCCGKLARERRGDLSVDVDFGGSRPTIWMLKGNGLDRRLCRRNE